MIVIVKTVTVKASLDHGWLYDDAFCKGCKLSHRCKPMQVASLQLEPIRKSASSQHEVAVNGLEFIR